MASTNNIAATYSNVKVPLFEGENYDFRYEEPAST
jgi:hypothetical protein